MADIPSSPLLGRHQCTVIWRDVTGRLPNWPTHGCIGNHLGANLGEDIDAHLLLQQRAQGRARAADVDPLARALVVAVLERAGLGRRQPDLAVGRLLVDNVGAGLVGQRKRDDAGL